MRASRGEICIEENSLEEIMQQSPQIISFLAGNTHHAHQQYCDCKQHDCRRLMSHARFLFRFSLGGSFGRHSNSSQYVRRPQPSFSFVLSNHITLPTLLSASQPHRSTLFPLPFHHPTPCRYRWRGHRLPYTVA